MLDLINTLPRPIMAARVGGASIGYGPAQQLYAAQQSIPIFSGDKAHFQSFSFACSATFMDFGCDQVVSTSTDEWKKIVLSAPMATRKSEASATEAASDVVDGKVDKDTLEARSRFVSKTILSRLSLDVQKNVQAILTEDELKCGNRLWNTLVKDEGAVACTWTDNPHFQISMTNDSGHTIFCKY